MCARCLEDSIGAHACIAARLHACEPVPRLSRRVPPSYPAPLCVAAFHHKGLHVAIYLWGQAASHQLPEFDAAGGAAFGELTAANIGRSLAIVMDDNVVSSPNINERISTSGSIEGNFTQDEAKNLEISLNSGIYAPTSRGSVGSSIRVGRQPAPRAAPITAKAIASPRWTISHIRSCGRWPTTFWQYRT